MKTAKQRYRRRNRHRSLVTREEVGLLVFAVALILVYGIAAVSYALTHGF